MKLTLTTEERKAIFRGDDRALKRSTKPPIKAGETMVLSWTRGGKQIVDYDTGATVEISRRPTVWVEFKAPELRDGGWLVQFTLHDERQPVRHLAPVPGPHSSPGLRTRWRNPADVPERGEQNEPWDKETERGYTGSARRAVDSAEGVDDDYLNTFAALARNDRCEFHAELEVERADLREDARRRREVAVRDRLRETLTGLDPFAQVQLLARIEQDLREAAITAVA